MIFIAKELDSRAEVNDLIKLNKVTSKREFFKAKETRLQTRYVHLDSIPDLK